MKIDSFLSAITAKTGRAAIAASDNRAAYLDRYMQWNERGRSYAFRPHQVRDITRYAKNIARLLLTAGDDRDSNAVWYILAHGVALDIARHYGVPASTAAGVLAAVSPRMSWPKNINAAYAVMAAFDEKTPAQTDRGIAQKALTRSGAGAPAGMRPWLQAVKVARNGITAVTGPKRVAFAGCIATGGLTNAVTVDGHALMYSQEKPNDNGTRSGIGGAVTALEYEKIAVAHAIVSALFPFFYTPAQVQAAAWVAHREKTVTS